MRLLRFQPPEVPLDPPGLRAWLIALSLGLLAVSCTAWGLLLWIR